MTPQMPAQLVHFRGRSGEAVGFERVSRDAAWATGSGVAIFAAREVCGWRIIRVVELSGRAHDVQPIWALAEAERYGADAVFVKRVGASDARRSLADDIETGFRPVMSCVRLAA